MDIYVWVLGIMTTYVLSINIDALTYSYNTGETFIQTFLKNLKRMMQIIQIIMKKCFIGTTYNNLKLSTGNTLYGVIRIVMVEQYTVNDI